MSRMLARPGSKEAFIVGVLVYSPSLTFIAAVQVVATAKESLIASVLALALVIVDHHGVRLAAARAVPARSGRGPRGCCAASTPGCVRAGTC